MKLKITIGAGFIAEILFLSATLSLIPLNLKPCIIFIILYRCIGFILSNEFKYLLSFKEIKFVTNIHKNNKLKGYIESIILAGVTLLIYLILTIVRFHL